MKWSYSYDWINIADNLFRRSTNKPVLKDTCIKQSPVTQLPRHVIVLNMNILGLQHLSAQHHTYNA